MKAKCNKCGKPANEFGHIVSLTELGEKIKGIKSGYYHWDCYDPEYNKKIDLILEEAHKDD